MEIKVGVIDHGVGNSIAVINLLRKIGVETIKITDSSDLIKLSLNEIKLVLPGVGSFDAGMKSLESSKLDVSIRDFALQGGNILGICLGMQMLFDSSEEGDKKGLSLIPGSLIQMRGNKEYRVPHVGWEDITLSIRDPLFENIEKLSFYHNHSYALPSNNLYEIASIDYPSSYSVAVRKNNILGVQFHPEKSHHSGEQLLINFINN